MIYQPSHVSRQYSWPLAPNVMVDVAFRGDMPTPAQIDVMRQYLEVVRTVLDVGVAALAGQEHGYGLDDDD